MDGPTEYDEYLASIGAIWGCDCGCGGTDYSDYNAEDWGDEEDEDGDEHE